MTGVTAINMKVPEFNIEGSQQKSSTQCKRTVTIATVIFVIVLAVSGITLAAVYFGSHLTHKAQHQGHVTVHTAEGETIKEIIAIRQEEVEVTEPGKFSLITDYKKSLSVFKVGSGNEARCYVSHLNTSVVGTREEVEQVLQQQDQFISPESLTVEYVRSGRDVNPALLGENAQVMCGGLDIEWLATSTTETGLSRTKRCSGGGKDKIIIVVVIVIIKERKACAAE